MIRLYSSLHLAKLMTCFAASIGSENITLLDVSERGASPVNWFLFHVTSLGMVSELIHKAMGSCQLIQK